MARRPLPPEDAALWAEVARSVRPLHAGSSGSAPINGNPPATTVEPVPERPVTPETPTRLLMPDFRVGALARPTTPARPATAPAIDTGLQRALVRGRLVPEARLDLHGYTLADAHPELVRFVLRAHGAERRLLLVITGKGRERADILPGGLLRQQVPRWLRLQPVAPVVLHQSTAHQRHGGAGALYVYLRRRR